MMNEPNYSEYSEEEFRFALVHIDSKKHPDRLKAIEDRLREIENDKREKILSTIKARYSGGLEEASLEFRKRIRTSAKYCMLGALFIVINLSSNYINQFLAIIGFAPVDAWDEAFISAASTVMFLMAYKSAKCPMCDKYIGGNLWTTNSCRACGTEFL